MALTKVSSGILNPVLSVSSLQASSDIQSPSLKVNNVQTIAGTDITPRMIKVADTGVLTSGASIVIDNCFSTTYQHYVIDIFTKGTTDESTVWGFVLRTGGVTGSDYGAANYMWRRYRHYTGHTVNEIDAASGDTAVSMNLYNRSNTGVMSRINVYMPMNTNVNTYFDGYLHGNHPGGNANSFAHTFSGGLNTTQAFTGIRFFGRSAFTGSFSSARMIVYGYGGI